ncbi:MAG TPA: ThiF family adenylyltransferase [Gammaproteobacteria bacterium]|nr:ThiF family adenylyltransferase [Gammaproteobacteria bacterium]
MQDAFDYRAAFDRNIGWVSAAEQDVLRSKRVAIAGLGGVGGSHLVTLARLGIGNFNLADLDSFELANFNRQAGATVSTLGRPKAEVVAGLGRDINPTLDIRLFNGGVDADNVDRFLDGVDVYVDGLDFFAVAARRAVFHACEERGIPAVTAAPLGMGTALLNFLPGRMTFEEYFRLEGVPEDEQLIRFLLGLSPAMLQRAYLVEPSAVNLMEHRGPSTAMACELCAGVAATQVLKLLLNRGRVLAAPWGLQFDAYRNRLVRTWRPGGNRHPVQRLGLAIARRQLKAMAGQPASERPVVQSTVEKVLEAARWAPSGDNAQPWRFEITGEHTFVVHGHDTRDHCVYDLQGHASQLALGALLETARIAASTHGLAMEVERRTDTPVEGPTFDVRLVPDGDATPDPLAPYVRVRTVQRRAMQLRRLSARERAALEAAVGDGYAVKWMESFGERLAATRLIFRNAGLRLTLPEAYPVHRDIIEWGVRFSEDRMPAAAIGLDPMTLKLTRWAMARRKRIEFLNRYLGGTLLPRLQLELVPGLACAGHFLLLGPERPAGVDDFVAAGGAMQRFWLTAAQLGLQLQPEMTPLIFDEYVRDEVRFSADPSMIDRARAVAAQLRSLVGEADAERAVFMGRIGAGAAPKARSVRLPLKALLVGPEENQ